jgi:hypothetical protein
MPRRKDENETAFDVLEELLGRDAERDGIPQEPKPEKVSYRGKAGRKGGKIGRKVRANKLTVKRKHEIAKSGAKARWRQT